MCNDGYHDESCNEQFEAQFGPYDRNEDADMGIPALEVDAMLRRIDKAVRQHADALAFADLIYIIAQERERLGLPAEVKV